MMVGEGSTRIRSLKDKAISRAEKDIKTTAPRNDGAVVCILRSTAKS